MAIYTIELDGKRYDIQGDREPSEAEARQAVGEFSSDKSTDKPTINDQISKRPSAIADLTKNPTSMEHPLGALLRTIGGASELYQGIPASIALDLQAGKPQDILGNLGKVVTGQRPAQYGDVFKGAGVPEPLAAAGGLAADIALSPGGVEGAQALGKGAIAAGKMAANTFKYDSALQQAQKAKVALDTIRTNLGKAKEIALMNTGDIPAELDWGKNVSQKVVTAIKNPIYNIEFTPEGGVVGNIRNLDKIKTALNDIVTQKDFVEAGNMEKRQVMQFAGRVKDTMVGAANAAGKPELGQSLSDYHKFMDNYSKINDHLVDKYGDAMANKLKAMFKPEAEQAVKESWKELSKTNPQVKSIMDSMNKRQVIQGLLKKAGYVGTGALAIEGVKKIASGKL